MATTYCLVCGPEHSNGDTCACSYDHGCDGLMPHTVSCDRCGDLHASDDTCGCRRCENCDRYPGTGGCECRCCWQCGELSDLCGCYAYDIPLSKEEERALQKAEDAYFAPPPHLTDDDLPF